MTNKTSTFDQVLITTRTVGGNFGVEFVIVDAATKEHLPIAPADQKTWPMGHAETAIGEAQKFCADRGMKVVKVL